MRRGTAVLTNIRRGTVTIFLWLIANLSAASAQSGKTVSPFTITTSGLHVCRLYNEMEVCIWDIHNRVPHAGTRFCIYRRDLYLDSYNLYIHTMTPAVATPGSIIPESGPYTPYSGKLSWEKTFANWWKRFSRRELSRIARWCHQETPRPQILRSKLSRIATKPQNSRKFSAIPILG